MKRGQSGKSLVLAVDKPQGATSHDVVNAARRAFGEKRVGHAGTLDPFATGVLPILVGPATRLDKYMVGHDKRYDATVTFGTSTTTDDCEGEILRKSEIPVEVADRRFAEGMLSTFLGKSMQVPPAYSAIKVGGKKACDEARRGRTIRLEPRKIAVHTARLLSIDDAGMPDRVEWSIAFEVSKGTYIRALARDIGARCKTAAHLGALRRIQVGAINIEDCIQLEHLVEGAPLTALDPAAILGFRIAFVDEKDASIVANGGVLPYESLDICAYRGASNRRLCECIPSIAASAEQPFEGELFSVVKDDLLLAVYKYDSGRKALLADCVFQTGVERGTRV